MLQIIITIIITVIAMLTLGLGVTLLRRRHAIRKHEEYRESFIEDYLAAREGLDRPRRGRKVSENRK